MKKIQETKLVNEREQKHYGKLKYFIEYYIKDE